MVIANSAAVWGAEEFAASMTAELSALKNRGYNVLETGESAAHALLSQYDAFIFDIDGVLLWGSTPLCGVRETLQALRRLKKRIIFLTNTAAKSRKSCAEGFLKLGIEVEESEVVTMAYVAAFYVKEMLPEAKVVFGIGSPALRDEFAAVGVRLIFADEAEQDDPASVAEAEQSSSPTLEASATSGGKVGLEEGSAHGSCPRECAPRNSAADEKGGAKAGGKKEPLQNAKRRSVIIRSEEDFAYYAAHHLSPDVAAVVVGWDRAISFHKLCVACMYLQQPRKTQSDAASPAPPQQNAHATDEGDEAARLLPFLATNRDAFNRVNGLRVPTNGAQLAALELTTGRTAVCVGKESSWLAEWLPRHLKIDVKTCVVVGDRIDTDILFAARAGAASCLCLTGCCTLNDLQGRPSQQHPAPTFILPHVALMAIGGEQRRELPPRQPL